MFFFPPHFSYAEATGPKVKEVHCIYFRKIMLLGKNPKHILNSSSASTVKATKSLLLKRGDVVFEAFFFPIRIFKCKSLLSSKLRGRACGHISVLFQGSANIKLQRNCMSAYVLTNECMWHGVCRRANEGKSNINQWPDHLLYAVHAFLCADKKYFEFT